MLERTSSAKLDKMLSIQKFASDQTGLGYDFSFPSIAFTSTTIFVSPTNNVESENNNDRIPRNLFRLQFVHRDRP